jgi:hypothetical protein
MTLAKIQLWGRTIGVVSPGINNAEQGMSLSAIQVNRLNDALKIFLAC